MNRAICSPRPPIVRGLFPLSKQESDMMKVSVEIEELTLDQLNAVSGGDHDPGSRSGGGGGTGTGPRHRRW